MLNNPLIELTNAIETKKAEQATAYQQELALIDELFLCPSGQELEMLAANNHLLNDEFRELCTILATESKDDFERKFLIDIRDLSLIN